MCMLFSYARTGTVCAATMSVDFARGGNSCRDPHGTPAWRFSSAERSDLDGDDPRSVLRFMSLAAFCANLAWRCQASYVFWPRLCVGMPERAYKAEAETEVETEVETEAGSTAGDLAESGASDDAEAVPAALPIGTPYAATDFIIEWTHRMCFGTDVSARGACGIWTFTPTGATVRAYLLVPGFSASRVRHGNGGTHRPTTSRYKRRRYFKI